MSNGRWGLCRMEAVAAITNSSEEAIDAPGPSTSRGSETTPRQTDRKPGVDAQAPANRRCRQFRNLLDQAPSKECEFTISGSLLGDCGTIRCLGGATSSPYWRQRVMLAWDKRGQGDLRCASRGRRVIIPVKRPLPRPSRRGADRCGDASPSRHRSSRSSAAASNQKGAAGRCHQA